MFPVKVLDTDKLGVIYVKLDRPETNPINDYFEGVEKLQSFLRSEKLEAQITGFYLSMWQNGGIRFSYFTNNSNPEETTSFLDTQFTSIGFIRYLPNEDKKPHDESFQYYHGRSKTNLDFRRFLQLITNIGLDLLQHDLLYSRRLVAKYRLEIAPVGISSKSYFEQAFKKVSYFNTLTNDLKNELLDGLDYWHTTWEDWAHMFVVMLLPGDWLCCCKPVFYPRRPIYRETRELLSGGLLPNDWES